MKTPADSSWGKASALRPGFCPARVVRTRRSFSRVSALIFEHKRPEAPPSSVNVYATTGTEFVSQTN